MPQNNNPYAKFTPQARTIPDPKAMSATQFTRYHSHEMEKINSSLRTYKRSLLYVGGCLGVILLTGWIANKHAKLNILGSDGKGGSYLNLTTRRSQNDYAYNRQFQRMMVLSQGHTSDSSNETTTRMLVDMGIPVKNYGTQNFGKRAPHQKWL